ncbi:hypothetical protein AB0K09_15180 [Streptomyces sp. NPDC049577]|uniref:hypothetical protein n=1 Tax=Streptomyces sp. NPDC049577 TaxID=3155153 RepID=UPI0034216724
MIWAVFTADRKVLARFPDDCGRYDPAELADHALRTTYHDVRGAFVDRLCDRHDERASDCRACATQLACTACKWPGYVCPKHRGRP